MFSGKGGQGRRRKKRRGETLEREESWWTEACLQFQNSPTADSWVHFNFSLIIHPFLSLKSLLLICAKCLMLWDHSEYHLLDTAQGIDNSNSFPLFFFSFKSLSFHFGFKLKSLFPFYLITTHAQGWKMKRISNVIHHFFLFFLSFSLCGGVDMQPQFIRTVNTCI